MTRPTRAERQRLRDAYREYRMEVLAAISAVDPYGLIAGDAPADEFGIEADAVLSRIGSAGAVGDCAAVIAAVLSEWLGWEAVPGELEPCGARVWAARERFLATHQRTADHGQGGDPGSAGG
ncbi:MAG: hypothetical protein IT303_03390 [Dehalococcoidia bacterium]|nr:hypothetical protein [Dehalococcoidia bacterium]